MDEGIRDMLAREAEEAEAAADAREADGSAEKGGRRARLRAGEATQVYSVRIPVDRLEELRRLADERGVRPTVLLRQFVLDRLAREMEPVEIVAMPERDPNELRLGPPRSVPRADVVPLRRERRA